MPHLIFGRFLDFEGVSLIFFIHQINTFYKDYGGKYESKTFGRQGYR